MLELVETCERIREITAELTREALARSERTQAIPPEMRAAVVTRVCVDAAKGVLARWVLDDLGYEAAVGVAQKAIAETIAAWHSARSLG